MRRRFVVCATILTAAMLAATLTGQQPATGADDALVEKARQIHERVITLDTHVDINAANFTRERNYTQELDRVQVTLPRMFKGGLDAAFFIVYVGQNRGPDAFTPTAFDAVYKQAIEKFDAIHRLTKEIAPDRVELALTPADVRRINAAGKKIALIGVENGYSLGGETTAIARVQEFYDRGARYLSLSHNGHSQLADSNTGEADGVWLHKGLSPLGRRVIEELNRVGIMVDISHPSRESNLQAMALSRVPVIASHSGARAIQNHSRNLDDEQLLALKKNGGVAQAVALADYVKTSPASTERTAALDTLAAEFGVPAAALARGTLGSRGRGGAPGAAGGPPAGAPAGAPPAAGAPPTGGGRGNALAALTEERRTDLQVRLQELNARFPPPPRASVKDFVDHIDYIVKKIGIDHVGISSDFDGGGGVEGWADASQTFNVTLELVRRGYTEEQIAKIWSGNLLRVMEQAQAFARR